MHLGLLDAMPKTGIQRRRIMDFIYSLRDYPYTAGDFTDKDASLRTRHIKLVGDYAVTYWVDSPVNAVMVVDVRRADR
jgi:hypothetical protein